MEKTGGGEGSPEKIPEAENHGEPRIEKMKKIVEAEQKIFSNREPPHIFTPQSVVTYNFLIFLNH
ncbi:MAG: hypothetical protein JW874_06445 [Spirochaetales bacterium]|nr:hypothetical protein [Spirochaetales bacterium]